MADPEKQQHFYETRRFKAVLLLVVGVILLILVVALRRVLTPVLIALVLAYIADPVLSWLERHRVRRWVAVTLLYCVGLGLIALLVVVLGPRVADEARRLYRYVSEVAEEYGPPLLESAAESFSDAAKDTTGAPVVPHGTEESALVVGGDPAFPAQEESLERRNGDSDRLSEAMPDIGGRLGEYVHEHADRIASGVLTVFVAVGRNAVRQVSRVANFVLGLILVAVFTFFFMLRFRAMAASVKRHIPVAHRARTLHVIGRVNTAVSNFFRGRFVVSLSSAVIFSAGFRLSGIDFWLLVGLTAGLLEFIPILGVILALVPACALALLTPHPWVSLVGVALTFAVVEWLVEPVLGTFVISREVKLHPVTIILALLIGGELFGMFGMIASVPIAAITRILGEEFVLPPLRALAKAPPGDNEGSGEEERAEAGSP